MEEPPVRSSGPWYRRRPDVLVFVIIVGLSALVVLSFLGLFFLMAMSPILGLGGAGCSSNERAVIEEFPHYGDQRFTAFSGEVSCHVRYATHASRDEVLTYYDEQLRENGWEARWGFGFFTAADPKTKDKTGGERPSELPMGWAGGLDVCRGGYSYTVEYWPPPEAGGKQKSADGRFSPGGYPISGDEAVVDVNVADDKGGPCSQ